MSEIQALVARIFSASELVLNVGSEDGVSVGDRATVWRVVEINDPTTNESLGQVLRRRLDLDVTLVEGRFCIARVHIEPPNFMAGIFGRQTKWISGAAVDEDEHVPLKRGDQVTVYTTDEEEGPDEEAPSQ